MIHIASLSTGSCRKYGSFFYTQVLVLILACFFPAFQDKASGLTMQRVSGQGIPSFEDDADFSGLMPALAQAVEYYNSMNPESVIHYGKDRYRARDIKEGLEAFLRLLSGDYTRQEIVAFLNNHARVYEYVKEDKPVSVLFTGYFLMSINGMKKPTSRFCYPVYGMPYDMVSADPKSFGCRCPVITGRVEKGRLIPYFDRKAIEEEGVLAGRAPVIAWTDDPIALFFMHIQGSGIINFPDGESISVGYAGTNGRPYVSIGKVMVDSGLIAKEDISMKAIEDYLRSNPGKINDILWQNPRYVFFQKKDQGAGSLGVPLTPRRSLALDPVFTPRGTLVWVDTKVPLCGGDHDDLADPGRPKLQRFARFMLHQDTGAAIKGPGRADIFFGSGRCARISAGYLKSPGRIYYIVLNP